MPVVEVTGYIDGTCRGTSSTNWFTPWVRMAPRSFAGTASSFGTTGDAQFTAFVDQTLKRIIARL